MSNIVFGSCCTDMKEALDPSNKRSLFQVQDNGVLYITTGYVPIENGKTGWFDMAAIFCPFCGTKIQDKDEIKKNASQDKNI